MMTTATLLRVKSRKLDLPDLSADVSDKYFLEAEEVESNRRHVKHLPDDLMNRVVSASHISGRGPDYAAGLLAAIGPDQSFIWLDGPCTKLKVLDLVQESILTSRCLRGPLGSEPCNNSAP